MFAINTDGSGFTNLYSFASGSTNSGGSYPWAGLILYGNTLYGTATGGGNQGGEVYDQAEAKNQPSMATGLDLNGPPMKFPPSKTPE